MRRRSRASGKPSLLGGLDVVRPIDVEHERQNDAIDRPAFVDQPFEIVAQTVETRRRRARLDAPEASKGRP